MNTIKQPDLVGIGNAIVDVLAKTDDAFLAKNKLQKGTMALIETDEAEKRYAQMGPAVAMSGGSAANTMAGFASLGGYGCYIGKVSDDQLGEVFKHDIRAAGVHYNTPALTEGPPTARCLVCITPDAQRTMSTYLGASTWISPEDLDKDLISGAKVTYLEGYLFDRNRAKMAFRKAADIAHKAGKKVALTLSDPLCVERHRVEFQELVQDHIDILFANEEEIKSLYKVDSFEAAMQLVSGHCEIAALTQSEKGSTILSGENVYQIAAEPPSQIVDTTGAGDLYAAGFLYGYTQGMELPKCGRIAAISASEVIGHVGARPLVKLADLVRQKAA